MLNETLRSRWFSACLHAGLWLLLLLAVVGIGGRAPNYREAEADPGAVITPVPMAKLQNLFAATNWPGRIVDTASLNPFSTTHFLPPTIPVTTPTTRRIELTYQGFYQTTDGPRRVMLRFGDTLIGIPVGGSVVSNLFVAEATFKTLTLTNHIAQTNVLTVNVKKEVEVPLK